jgi:anti-anti-sigma factor
MDSDVRRTRDSVVVSLGGDADLGAAPSLKQVFSRAVAMASDSTTVLVIDLDGVLVLDDTAIGLVVGAAAGARRAGLDVELICTDPRLRARLAETRVDQILTIRDERRRA